MGLASSQGCSPGSAEPAAAPAVCLLEEIDGLPERLASVPDHRSRRGVWHHLASTLLLTTCALAVGKNGYTHIHAWAADASGATPPS